MAAHRYWRIIVTAVNGGAVAGLSEIQLRGVSGGPDLTPGSGTAISNSEFGGSLVKANAFDNSSATDWASTFPFAPGSYIGWDAGAGTPIDVEEFTLASRTTDVSNAGNQSPKDFALQFSDDLATWTTKFQFVNITGWGVGEVRTFTNPLLPLSVGTPKYIAYVAAGALPGTVTTPKYLAYAVAGPVDLSTPKYIAYAVVQRVDIIPSQIY